MSKRRTAALAVAILIGGGPAVAAADVVQDWNAHALAATNAQNPFLQARSIAIVQLAVFEAVNAVVGDYERYLGTVSASVGASVDAAAIAMAVSDGLVSSMETKYHYNFWRPITAIRAGDSDDNEKTAPDPGWTPFVGTPCFPSYPSAHASASYAARKIVVEILGGGNHWITLAHPNTPVTLSYTKFSEITDDIDDARIYGGIHFRFDQAAGAVQGRAVGLYVCQNNLRRISGDSGTCRE